MEGELSEKGDYRELATRERELAQAASERAKQAREGSRHAAFYDTALALSSQAAEEERTAQAHLEAARQYDRLAREGRAT
jgi:hypothetical protein